MKHIFVVNPAAGKSQAEKELLPRIMKGVASSGLDFEIYITKGISDAENFVKVKSQIGEPVRFYACGGDGTLNEVFNGAHGFDNVQVAAIPIGTGNDFIKTFSDYQFFNDIDKQLRAKPITIDLMRYNGRLGVNVCNIGFDSAVADKIAKLKTYPLVSGKVAYGIGIIQQFFEKMGDQFTIEFDDGEVVEGNMLLTAVGNGRFYGGGFKALPLASRTSKTLDICLVKKISRIQFLSLIKDYKKGLHTENPKFKNCVIYRKSPSVQIRGVKDFKLCVDGEITITRLVQISVVPKAIKFAVPEGCHLLE